MQVKASDLITPLQLRGNVHWTTQAKRRAKEIGVLRVVLADGRLRIYTRMNCGLISQTTYGKGKWNVDDS